jgi:type I restriction enzyme S subunit
LGFGGKGIYHKIIKMENKRIKYNLPQNWIWTTLGELGVVVSGGTPSTRESQFWGGNISWITPSDLAGYKNKYIAKGGRNITQLGLDYSSASLLPKGSLLFSSRAPIGYVVVANNELATSQGFKNLIPTSFTNVHFLYYYLQYAKSLIIGMAKGTTFLELSAASFNNVPIPLPPLTEQYRIVEKIEELFSELDKAEDDLKNNLQQLEIYKLSVLNETFRKNTEQWESFLIKDLFEFTGGGTPSKKQKQFWNGSINWASVKDVNTKYLQTTIDKITEDGLSNSSAKKANKGDVLLVTRISPGRVTISNIDVAINQDLKIVRSINKKFSPEFIYYMFCAYYKEIMKISSGTTVKGINLSQLNNLEIRVPSTEQCDRIVQELDRVYSHTANISKEIESTLKHIEYQKQSVLNKAFKGELVSQNPDDEPAAQLLAKIKEEKELYIQNQKNMSQIKSKGKYVTPQLIDSIKHNFANRSFTYEDIKDTISISYEDLKNQLFSLLESKQVSMSFDKNIRKISYRINHEN